MCRQIPIGATHISFSGHTGLSKISVGQPRVAPGGHRQLTGWTNTRRSTGPGGKIMMTLRSATPKGKLGGGEANGKTKVGPCWRCFIQRETSRSSHNTQPRKERRIKEYNTGMTKTKAARVEQNTRQKAEPSTLYQVWRCIKITR